MKKLLFCLLAVVLVMAFILPVFAPVAAQANLAGVSDLSEPVPALTAFPLMEPQSEVAMARMNVNPAASLESTVISRNGYLQTQLNSLDLSQHLQLRIVTDEFKSPVPVVSRDAMSDGRVTKFI